MSTSSRPSRLIQAPALIDATGVVAAPGAMLLGDAGILAVGTPESIGPVDGLPTERLDDEVLTPAFANAHTHLDLSHLSSAPVTLPARGQFERSGGGGVAFLEWVEWLRAGRLTAPVEIAASVHLGITLSLAGGVAAVGDIAGARSLVPVEELRASSLRGVSFVEVFGQGVRQQPAIDFLDHVVEVMPLDADGVRLGLQPHAPYSCGPRVYAHAAELGRRRAVPLSTHVAETREEIEFVRSASGPFADLLRRLGVWDDSIVGLGVHPVDAIERSLGIAPWLLAHANHIEDRHLHRLAATSATVAFCPRSHRFFGHDERGDAPHRWREMLGAGVRVAIATDGLPSIDSTDRITPLDDARMLHAQGGADATALMAAITTTPAAALALDPQDFLLRPGAHAGVLAIRSARARITSPEAPFVGDGEVRWVVGPWEW